MENKSFTHLFIEFIAPLAVFFTPLIFLPFTANYFATPQLAFLVILTLILLCGVAFDLVFYHTLPQSNSKLRLALVLFGASIIINLLVNPEGRTESLTTHAPLFISLSVIAYFLSSLPPTSKAKIRIVFAFVATSTLLAIHAIFQLTYLHSLSILPLYMQTKGFTPTANPLTTISVLITASIVAFIASIHQRSPLHKYLYLVSAAISTIASTAYLSLMLNGGSLAPIILPLSSSWSLLLDSLKDPHNLIFGVGLTNFSALYTSVKPLFLNSTIFWNLIPTTASTEIIQLIITTGILGFGALLLLLYSGLKQVSNLTTISSKPVSALFILSTITLFLIPGSIIGYVLLFISLGILCSGESSILLVQKSTSYLLALGIFSIVIFSGFYLFKYVSAEYFLNQARISLQNSDAKQVYEYSLKAVEQIPSMSNYRLSYSQVNLSIASSLSQQSNPTEEQLKNINQLITQALREAKIATTLRPHDSFSWQNLAKIYANLSTVAEGSDKFAIESYSQAIALDAGNPSLRTDFAILLSQLASTSTDETTKLTYLTRAASEFRTAIQLKNDFAPAYYNLAKVLESAGDYQNALANMQIAIELLTSDSPDLDRARQELEVLKTKLPVPSPAPTANP